MDSKVIVITGASAGIGAASARLLGTEGHKLVLAGRREAELKQVAKESGNQAMLIKCDVTIRKEVDSLRDAALKHFGAIDVWINNAGRGINKKTIDLSDEDFDEIVRVNLKSALYGMQAIIPYFQRQKKGHLINISSFLGRVPFVTFRSIYSAAKSALNILTANLRMDLKDLYPDIKVSLVLPGRVSTDFSKNAIGGTPQVAPVGGMMQSQTAEDVASVISDVIKNPLAEVYTNPILAEIAANYYRDVGAFEDNMRQGK